MANEDFIDELLLNVNADSKSAQNKLDNLISSLEKIESHTKSSAAMRSLMNSVQGITKAANEIKPEAATNLNSLVRAMEGLEKFGSLKLSSTLPTNIKAIADVAGELEGRNFGAIESFGKSLSSLENAKDIRLTSVMNQLGRLPGLAEELKASDLDGFDTKIQSFADALEPISALPKQNLTGYITQLKKLPEVADELDKIELDKFETEMNRITAAIKPLATEMEKVSNGFSAFPSKIQKLLNSTEKIPSANKAASLSYTELWSKIKVGASAVDGISDKISGAIKEMNNYIENVNLFSASMGRYTDDAKEYASSVGEVMGIDPGEWMKNQGIFMTLSTGFGIAGDRASLMSKNLTQLGYDISSFYNISTADAMTKLQSGLSGELEPLRRLGYDLSQAKLESVALSLGIDKSVKSMTQAEKAQLRYYAIMTQVTQVQGDMARTLESPANQMRILSAQMTQFTRSLGSVFIPMLNKVLPYAIAAVEVGSEILDIIAELSGFEMPEFDYSGLENVSSGADDVTGSLDEADESAKKLQRTILGIDEINKMGDFGESISNGVDDLLGGFDFDLPQYDFIAQATEGRVKKIVDEMRDWLGISEDIQSWSDLMDTNFGNIVGDVATIGATMLTWKVATGVKDFLSGMKNLTSGGTATKIGVGLTLGITGFKWEFDAIQSLVESNGASTYDWVKGSIGLAAGVGGTALLLGGGPVGWGLGIGLALTLGIAALMTADGDGHIKRYWQSEDGKALRARLDDLMEYSTSVKLNISEITGDIDSDLQSKLDSAQSLLDDIFELEKNPLKTPAQLTELNALIEAFHGLDLRDTNNKPICLEFDQLTGSITSSKEALESLLAERTKAAKLEALYGAYQDAYVQKLELEKSDEFFDAKIEATRLKSLEKVAYGSFMSLRNQGTDAKMKEIFDFVKSSELNDAAQRSTWYIELLAEGYNISQIKKYMEYMGEVQDAKNEYEIAQDKYNEANSVVESMSESLKELTNKIEIFAKEIDMLTNGISSETVSNSSSSAGNLSISGNKNNLSGNYITQRAVGGFPEHGEIFIANENGPEVIGKIGSRTAVANNDQIIEGIKRGVKEALAERQGGMNGDSIVIQIVDENGRVKSQKTVSELKRNNYATGRNVVVMGY